MHRCMLRVLVYLGRTAHFEIVYTGIGEGARKLFGRADSDWRRRVGEGIHCTALEQVTRKVLDAYTVRTRVRVHAYGYTFIARYAHDSTVTVRGSSVHLAVAMAFAPPASKHASRVANLAPWPLSSYCILPLIEGSPTPRHRRRRATWANQMGLMGHVASVRKHRIKYYSTCYSIVQYQKATS